MGNELHLKDYCTISCKLIWLSPETRHSADRPCKTKQRPQKWPPPPPPGLSLQFQGKEWALHVRHGSSWVKLKRKPVGCWECPNWKHMLVAWITTQRFCSVLAQWLYWHIIHQPQQIESSVRRGRLVGWAEWFPDSCNTMTAAFCFWPLCVGLFIQFTFVTCQIGW